MPHDGHRFAADGFFVEIIFRFGGQLLIHRNSLHESAVCAFGRFQQFGNPVFKPMKQSVVFLAGGGKVTPFKPAPVFTFGKSDRCIKNNGKENRNINEEKAEQNSVLFNRLTLKERGLRPNGYFPLMRQPFVRYMVTNKPLLLAKMKNA